MTYKLISDYKPTGDQPQAIVKLVDGINKGEQSQVLLGVTGSGKTFTMEGYKYNTNEKGLPTAIVEPGENEGIVPRSVHLLYEMVK